MACHAEWTMPSERVLRDINMVGLVSCEFTALEPIEPASWRRYGEISA